MFMSFERTWRAIHKIVVLHKVKKVKIELRRETVLLLQMKINDNSGLAISAHGVSSAKQK